MPRETWSAPVVRRAGAPSRAFVITGFHRSGTSLVAAYLARTGLFIGHHLKEGELLDEEDRELVLLRQWDGLEFAVLGERLGVSTDAARMRFQRAVGRLAQTLERLRRSDLSPLLA